MSSSLKVTNNLSRCCIIFLAAGSQYSHGESSPWLVLYRVIPLEKQGRCIIEQNKPLFERSGNLGAFTSPTIIHRYLLLTWM